MFIFRYWQQFQRVMVRPYLIFLFGLFGILCYACVGQSSDGGNLGGENLMIPYVEADGKVLGTWSRQVLRQNEMYRAKMAHRLHLVRDSSGHSIMKAFKNYDLVFTADTLSNYHVIYKSESLARFIEVRNDTAFINIPIDTLFSFGYDSLVWVAGYDFIDQDTRLNSVRVGGKWILEH